MKALRFGMVIVLTFYSFPTILAGLDIYRGTEPDLSTEWIIVSVFFVLNFVFLIINLLELRKEIKQTTQATDKTI